MIHYMTISINRDTCTTTFTCPICDRCVEVRPDGMHIVYRGEVSIPHKAVSPDLEIHATEIFIEEENDSPILVVH